MATSGASNSEGSSKLSGTGFLHLREPTGAALSLQKELLAAYDEASRIWLARMRTEVALWSDLAAKLGTTKTMPEALEAYAQCVSQRMQMAADDGRLLVEEAQQIAEKITRVLRVETPADRSSNA